MYDGTKQFNGNSYREKTGDPDDPLLVGPLATQTVTDVEGESADNDFGQTNFCSQVPMNMETVARADGEGTDNDVDHNPGDVGFQNHVLRAETATKDD